ncbi:tautomerase family protein [Marasmitruncus massiliensis]|uniref:tautomerase family protein n=1 Tax=Marasmitruncus massiliensis TaxID=1944642 RepID=UPI000C7BC551|nr:tautomerase family protein [Marasmitruncus massiliensis]
MPRTTIEILEGRSLEQKRALVKQIGLSVSECFHVPTTAALVRIVEVKFEDFGSDCELRCDTSLREGKPAYGRILEPRITVQFFEGHPFEEKRALVKVMAERVAKILELPLEDVKIFLLEMKYDQMATGGLFASEDPKAASYTYTMGNN